MPRNGSGVYSLPSGINPVVTQTLITSNWANTTMTDVANALTGSVARDGQSPMTGNLNMGGFQVVNLGPPTQGSSAVSLSYVQSGAQYRLTNVAGVNDISATLPGGVSAFVTGQIAQLVANATNTGPMTLSINGSAAAPILSNAGLPLGPTNIQNGQAYLLQYRSGTGWYMVSSPNEMVFAQSAISGWDRPNVDGNYPLLSIQSNSSINVPSGAGRLIKPSTRDASGVMEVTWPTQVVVLTNLATAWSTTIGVDANGNIVQLTGTPLAAWARQYILLGTVAHPDGKIEGINTVPAIYGDMEYATYDISMLMKNQVISGGRLFQPLNPLHISIQAGRIFRLGGLPNQVNAPNFVDFTQQNDIVFWPVTGNNTVLAATQLAPVNEYDPGGVGTVEPIPGSPTSATIHRLYDLAGQRLFVFGQSVYSDLKTALSLLSVDDSTYKPPSKLQDATFLGYVVMQQNCVAVNDGTTGQLVSAGGQSVVLGSAGSISDAPLDGRTYGRNSGAWVTAVDEVEQGANITVDKTDVNKPVVAMPSGNLTLGQGVSFGPGQNGNGRLVGAPSLSLAGWAPNRNKLINGDFSIWQRNTGLGPSTGAKYVADRWKGNSTGTTLAQWRQPFAPGQTDVPGNPNFFYQAIWSSVAGANNSAFIMQGIEDVAVLAGQTCTLSFWAMVDVAKNIGLEFQQGFGSGGSPSAYVTGIAAQKIAIGTAWKYYTITFQMPSIAGKTLGTNYNSQTNLILWLDAGATANTTPSNPGQQSGWLQLSQVQLEIGGVATPFEWKSYADKLALCLRYFRLSPIYAIGRWGGTSARLYFDFNNGMRTTPAATLGSQNVSIEEAQVAGHTCTDASFATVAGDNYRMFCDIKGTWTGAAPTPGNVAQLDSAQGQIGFDAEL